MLPRAPGCPSPSHQIEVVLSSLLKFLLFAAALIAIIVFVGVPLVAQTLITSAVRDAGLDAEGVDVQVDLLGSSILNGRAPAIRVTASGVAVDRALIGDVDLTLRDVSVTERTFSSVTGTLSDVRVTGPNGQPFTIQTIDVDGTSDDTRARGYVAQDEAERFVGDAVRDAGLDVEDVALSEGQVTLETADGSARAELLVTGDALVLEPESGEPVVLLAPAPTDPWRLQDVRVTADGLRIDVSVDAGAVIEDAAGS